MMKGNGDWLDLAVQGSRLVCLHVGISGIATVCGWVTGNSNNSIRLVGASEVVT